MILDIAIDPDAPILDGRMIFHVAFMATKDTVIRD